MKKVLFTHSYFYKFDPKQWKTKQFYPPLATIYAASFIRENGFDVSLFDTNLQNSPDDIITHLKSFNPDYLVIYDDGFNYLTKMCLTNMREAAFRLSEIGKQFGCKVLICSSDSTDHYNIYLNRNADFVLLGEAEITLLETLKAFQSNDSDFNKINGLAFCINDKTVVTDRREILKDLDSLPQPAWDLIDVASYKKIWVDNNKFFSLNIATTRGCPYKCNWCAKPIYGNRYNTRSPEKVIEELEYLLNKFQPGHFWFCDDIFGLKPGWVQEFRDLVTKKNLKFRYNIQSRVDLLLEEDTIDALAQSGADTVWVGAESGSQKVLDAMDKGTKVEQIYTARKLLKEKNVNTAFFLQFGYKGETKEDIKKTIDMLLELMPENLGISVSYPLPGTKFYEEVKSDLKTKANWSDSDDLAIMFRGTFTPEYYKKLHRYVHKIYRRKQGIITIKQLLLNPKSISKRTIRSAAATFYYIPMALINFIQLKMLETTT